MKKQNYTMLTIKNIIKSLFPQDLWDGRTKAFFWCLMAKFLIFDLIWSAQTTFSSLSMFNLYVNTFFVVLLLLLPYLVCRSRAVESVVLVALDLLLISNLMYSRTYNSLIPLASYAAAGNLSDFTASVVDSMRWIDLLFPLSTLLTIVKVVKTKATAPIAWGRRWKQYGITTAVSFALVLAFILPKGGLKQSFQHMQNANYYTCTAPVFTVFGNMLYDAMEEQAPYTHAMQARIDRWKASQPHYKALPDTIGRRTSLVVILCESLESWVINRKIEGKEITPNLNAAIAEKSTLYAPYVLTQVKGGRSIDCQLMLNAGLLPIQNGCYAMTNLSTKYYSLTKAMHQQNHSRSYLLSVDKPVTWNQQMVARAFGIDSLVMRDCWVNDEKVGSRKKLGDASFMRQAVKKMKQGQLWPVGQNVYMQFVTYSGHNPFVLPDKLKRIHLKGNYPTKMADYIYMANYTDYALGELLTYLKSRPDYKNMMIVITGDHEGLAADRADILKSKVAQGIVSPKQFTPFIVVNAPIGLHYEKVMGQIDMYPTVLNLMHLDNYAWKGLGQSILDPRKYPVAVGSNMNVEGKAPAKEVNRLKEAFYVSDLMIRYNKIK
jgi:lipoteichoic acid synthase